MTHSIDKLYGGKISFSFPIPRLILICGPCRVGTTALSNVFAKAGIESHMQPMKSARRAMDTGENVSPWKIGVSGGKFVAVKETFGPHGQSEYFEPLEILLGMGYPKEKLAVIPILREPAQVFCSWKVKFGVAEIKKLVQAYELTRQVKEKAEAGGISVFPYVHEAIRDNQPSAVLAMLFERLGLPIHQLSMTLSASWGSFKGSENVFFYDDPPPRFLEGIKERGKYEYKDRAVSQDDIELVESVPRLKEIYDSFYREC